MSVRRPSPAPAMKRYASERALTRESNSSEVLVNRRRRLRVERAAARRQPRERLVALDHPALDRVVVGPGVDEVPRLVGHVARALWVGRAPWPSDWLDSNALRLCGGLDR